MTTWRIEPRPVTYRGYRKQVRVQLLEKLIALAQTRQALRLTLTEHGPEASVRQSLHNLAKRRGYDYHAQCVKKDGSYLAWVTKRSNTTP